MSQDLVSRPRSSNNIGEPHAVGFADCTDSNLKTFLSQNLNVSTTTNHHVSLHMYVILRWLSQKCGGSAYFRDELMDDGQVQITA